MPSYRNWPAICAITNCHLKLCIALTKDKGLLDKLAKGFPELFTEEKPEHDGPWPLSVLRRAIVEAHEDERNASNANFILYERFSFPSISVEGIESNLGYGLRLNAEESSALNVVDKDRNADNMIAFPIGLERITVGGTEYYVGYTDKETYDAVDKLDLNAYLFPCSLVDENA